MKEVLQEGEKDTEWKPRSTQRNEESWKLVTIKRKKMIIQIPLRYN